MATAGLCNSTYHPGSLDSSCGDDGGRSVDWSGLLLVFFGVVLTGVGNCCYYMFGVPYLDDNTKHENAPFMLGAVYTFRNGITMCIYFFFYSTPTKITIERAHQELKTTL